MLPGVRIASLLPSMQRTERRVAEAILEDRRTSVELTAQQLAEHVGVGRTSVIRAARSLGYESYPQLRVALVQELALEDAAALPSEHEGQQGSALERVRARVARFSARLGNSVSALTPEVVDGFVRALDESDRVLVAANGLSSPIALDLVLRLNAVGRPSEHFMEGMAQLIAARQLGAGSVCIAVSGSGANRATLETLRAARASGAATIVVTSFAQSPATGLADLSLVIPPITDGFQDELMHTSRAALVLVVEQLVDAFVELRGDDAREARAAALSVLAGSLQA